MAQFPRLVIAKFASTSAERELPTSLGLLLENFFSTLGASSVQISDRNINPATAIHFIETEMARAVSGVVNPNSRVPNEAVNAGHSAQVSRGINFRYSSSNNRGGEWTVSYHRGPLPLIELRALHGSDLHVERISDAAFTNLSAADFIWADGRFGLFREKVFGPPDGQYLFWKREKLFPFSTGSMTEEAVRAGAELRGICRAIVQTINFRPRSGLPFISFKIGKRRFLQKFDQAILSQTGEKPLRDILARMGTGFELWMD